MTSIESVVVNPDHLYGADNTVKMALQFWSSRNDPVTYNTWQSLYFQLLRAGYEDDEEEQGETPQDRQGRIKDLYKEIQTEVHGPDHQASAMGLYWR